MNNKKSICSSDKFLNSPVFFQSKKLNVVDSIDFEAVCGIINAEIDICVERFIVVEKITKNKIRSLIGKWFPPSNGQLSINSAIEDIYSRISNRIEGRCDYHTGKTFQSPNGGRYVYTLIIKLDIVLFIDENREICYIIV